MDVKIVSKVSLVQLYSTCTYTCVCLHDVSCIHSPHTCTRFTFKQGTSSNCTVSTGYWTIDMEVDGEKYVRNTRTKIFSKFEIPTGASYACGNNSHNVFHVYTPPGNNTAVENQNVTSAYMFSGLQVHDIVQLSLTSYMYM